MSHGDRARGLIRRGVVDVLQRLRDRVEPGEESAAVEPPQQAEPTRASEPTVEPLPPVVLDPEDIQLDAFQVMDKAGIGYDFVFLDVRESHELAATGVIEGALHLPLGALPHRLDEVPRGQRVIVYCAAGARSTRAAMMLRADGHDDAWSLEGGVSAWLADGGELVPRAAAADGR